MYLGDPIWESMSRATEKRESRQVHLWPMSPLTPWAATCRASLTLPDRCIGGQMHLPAHVPSSKQGTSIVAL